MGEYRHKDTGEVKTQGEWRRHYSNTSLPRVWLQATLDGLRLDPVGASTPPTVGKYQVAEPSGAAQDASGDWVTAWRVVDMFSDTTENGVTTTKAEKEAAYQQELDEHASQQARKRRDALLEATDFYALTDVTMSVEMAAYRQALRDITQHVNFPNLDVSDWPIKP